MTDPPLTLRSGSLFVELQPAVGGAIARFEAGEVPVLRRAPASMASVLEAASFPLVPFVNRIRGGCFDFRGRKVRLRPNMDGDPSPLHGQGWLAEWQLQDRAADAAALVYVHAPGEWPWPYEARQQLGVSAEALSVVLSCRNLGDSPMPCGLGQHPYFPCGPQTRIDTGVKNMWTVDEKVLPVERIEATGRFDLSNRRVCAQGLDNGFDGWSGCARLSDPTWPFDIELTSKAARFFQLYSPEDGGIFVAEPVSHANAALNEPEERWPELGVRVLAPGEAMQLDMRIEVRPR